MGSIPEPSFYLVPIGIQKVNNDTYVYDLKCVH